jgi:hypothetical protein
VAPLRSAGACSFSLDGSLCHSQKNFRYFPSIITAPIDAKLAPFNQYIWLAGVETIRPIISEGTPKSFAIRPMDSVALIDM